MNNRLRRALWITAAVCGVIAAFAFGLSRMGPPPGNLAGSSVGGAFTLVDQDGRAVTDRDFVGRYRLMYFGYTSCPDVCPVDVGELARGLKAFAAIDTKRAGRVAAMFVTVDPQRDDPAAMKAFVRAFSPDLIGLTGSPAQVAAALKAYHVFAAKVPGPDPAHYLMNHVAVIYLFGPEGEPIAYLGHGATGADIAQMLKTYVR